MSLAGWIIGNLDEESRLSGVPLTRAARERSAALAMLLAAFGRDGDIVRLPAPVDARHTARLENLPDVSWTIDSPPSGVPLLPWMESTSWRRNERVTGENTWVDRLWACPPAPPDVVARVHSRGFLAEFDRGPRFRAARLAHTIDDVRAWLRVASPREWVGKAPYSAAGRDRIIAERTLDRATTVRIARLLERHGGLWLEPWVERIGDYGACALVTPEGVERIGVHKNEVDERGRFRGIALDPVVPPLAEQEQAALHDTMVAVAERVRIEGYLGPIGIDAYRYREGNDVVFQPLGELNARLTFGFVAHAVAIRRGRSFTRLDVAQLSGALPE